MSRLKKFKVGIVILILSLIIIFNIIGPSGDSIGGKTFYGKKIMVSSPPISKTPDEDFFRGLALNFEIHPFYHNSTTVRERLDNNNNNYKKEYTVTVVTQSTIDRLYKIGLMADKWKAPISVALYVKNRDTELPLLETILKENPLLRVYADIHLLFANNTRYPVNNLRNLAIKYSTTDLIFVMDADFLPPIGLHDYIVSHKRYFNINKENYNQKYKRIIPNVQFVNQSTFTDLSHTPNMVPEDQDLKVAFVIPSFSSSYDPSLLPDDKPTLLRMVLDKKIEPSNLKVCKKCHSPTNFQKWVQDSEPYEAVYRWIYEPYLVFDKTKTEWFDERLKGYGFDKNSHTLVMAMQGYRFIVLPEAFIIHINHQESTWEGPKQKQQQWDSLRIVCDLIQESKVKFNYDTNKRVLDEPLPEECYSNEHW